MTESNGRKISTGSTASDDIHARVPGTNIDEITLLTTDYLNHFNELVMVLEMVPDTPDMFDDAKDWRPLAYADHFQISGFPHGELAVEAYGKSPTEFRQPFDDTVRQLDNLVLDAIQQVKSTLEADDGARLADYVGQTCIEIRRLIDRASAVVHSRPGDVPGEAEPAVEANMDQSAIDSLFD